jgi:drug/metabolite transporter (DMT)-like permease
MPIAEDSNLPRQLIFPLTFVILWSSGAIFAKQGLSYTTPLMFLVYRNSLSSIVLWVVFFIWIRDLSMEKLLRNAVVACLLQIGYQVAFFNALTNDVTPAFLAVILALQPILTAMLARKGATAFQWAGLVLGLAGVCVTIGFSHAAASEIGFLWALLALASLTFGVIVQHCWSGSGNVVYDMAVQYTISGGILSIVSTRVGDFQTIWSWAYIASLAWMVLLVSVGATLILYHLLRQGSAIGVSSLFYCVPPMTALMDYTVYGDPLSWAQLGGMALVIAGLLFVNRNSGTAAAR